MTDKVLSPRPLISVIVPTRHRLATLAQCLDRLAPNAQSLACTEYEVIVTDDGTDQTAESLIDRDYHWARWLAGPQCGPAANRNNGAAHALGDWLVFTDDDCLPDEQWLEKYCDAIDGAAKAMEGAVHPVGNVDADLAECPVNKHGGCFWSANICVQKSAFEQINGFDTGYKFAAHEDADLYIRLKRLTNVQFIPDAAVGHPVRITSLRSQLRQIKPKCKTWAYHVVKHRNHLGLETWSKYLIKVYRQHLSLLASQSTQFRWRSATVTVAMLLYGIPLTVIEISKITSIYCQGLTNDKSERHQETNV